ncbi:UNVERIFIED_CONTAM: hypothetical protein FKN15_067274 [Acipenser sinensis]
MEGGDAGTPESPSSPLEVSWASRRNTEDGRCPLEDPRDVPYLAQSRRLSCRCAGESALWLIPGASIAAVFSEPVEQTELPPGYCKFYFNTNRGCVRNICWFQHVPNKGDEKDNGYFSLILVTVFTTYYRISPPGVHFNSEVMTRLLYRLLNESQMKEVFTVLQIVVLVKMLCVDAGLELTVENFNYMQRQLDLLQAPREEIDVFLAVKSRLLEKQARRNEHFDLDVAVAEVESMTVTSPTEGDDFWYCDSAPFLDGHLPTDPGMNCQTIQSGAHCSCYI